MKVLLACECSGVIRRAFRAAGHDAFSCDLQPAEDGSEHHIQADFRSVIQDTWDFIGFHYECRVMANSGGRWLYLGEKGSRVRNEPRWIELHEAADIFNITLRDPRPGYAENSIMHCHAKALIDRPQDQVVQPWHHGDPFFKATCLWLRGGLPPLEPSNRLTPPKPWTEEHKAWSAVHRAPPGPERRKNRARSFPGIAAAMAQQWGISPSLNVD